MPFSAGANISIDDYPVCELAYESACTSRWDRLPTVKDDFTRDWSRRERPEWVESEITIRSANERGAWAATEFLRYRSSSPIQSAAEMADAGEDHGHAESSAAAITS